MIQYTQKQLNDILNRNSKLKITAANSTNGDGNKKTILLNEQKKPHKIKLGNILDPCLPTKNDINFIIDNNKQPQVCKKILQSNIDMLNLNNLHAKYRYSFDESHFSFVIFGARLLSVNQIFALLQYRKYELFKYKKIWHKKIQEILADAQTIKNIPFFEDMVKITLFRQAPKLVDEDAMTTMYKFIIDAVKLNKNNNLSLSLIKEDNPKIVHEIACYSNKGDYAVGFKVEKITELKKPINLTDFF